MKLHMGIIQSITILIHLFESCSLAEEEIKAEQEVVEGMDISTRSKGKKEYFICVLQRICKPG